MDAPNNIDFQQFDGPLYSGRNRGESARTKINLNESENKQGYFFLVTIPHNFLVITSSFFLGLFGPSIQKCGSREKFLQKFDFSSAPPGLKPQIDLWIARALADRTISYL